MEEGGSRASARTNSAPRRVDDRPLSKASTSPRGSPLEGILAKPKSTSEQVGTAAAYAPSLCTMPMSTLSGAPTA